MALGKEAESFPISQDETPGGNKCHQDARELCAGGVHVAWLSPGLLRAE